MAEHLPRIQAVGAQIMLQAYSSFILKSLHQIKNR